MKYLKITIILIVFLKTGNLLSEDNIFNVNNIEVAKKPNLSNEQLANKAIKIGFDELLHKILLDQDRIKLSDLKLAQIKQLVSYYQLVKNNENKKKRDTVNFNIFFDKEKIHELFYLRKIFYSEIFDKELYLLPVFKKDEKINIFSQNFYYKNWNNNAIDDLIEFILPIENIEIIQIINAEQNNILDIDLKELFKEYENKNLAFLFIDEKTSDEIKVFFKTLILNKSINKNISFKKGNQSIEKYYYDIIFQIKKEITNIIKSQNLIDVRTPSFINAKFIIEKNKNLVELNRRLKQIDSIENLYIQEFNNKYVFLKIKYLGKLNKLIDQLKKEKIILRDIGSQWSLKILK